jgi:hypothetical protein
MDWLCLGWRRLYIQHGEGRNTVARYRVICIHFGKGAPVLAFDIVSRKNVYWLWFIDIYHYYL